MYKKYNLKCFEKRMQKFFGVSVVCFPKAKIPRESEQDGKSDEGVRKKSLLSKVLIELIAIVNTK